MSKSTYRDRYGIFLDCIREARKAAGITQVELARRLGETQTYVSKCERGERRVDLVELFDFLDAFGADSTVFVNDLRARIKRAEKAPSR